MSGLTGEKMRDGRGDEDEQSLLSGDEYEGGRRSEDVKSYDRETLGAEEEAERLLTGKGKQGRAEDVKHESRRQRRKDGSGDKKRRKKGELMYRLEEGGRRSSEESSVNSSEDDMRRLAETQARQKKKTSWASCCGVVAVVLVLIVGGFIAFVYGAYQASHETSTTKSDDTAITSSYKAKTLSNGTHTFAPTTLLISLDGFRADFLARNLTPTLNSFIQSGVSPKYMTPSFPSLTFPNHYTLVTGLYPESHGVVGNTFWDPSTRKEFYYTDPDRSMQPEWWLAEPLWLTAELAGVRSAIHMWPGSEAHIGSLEPTYVDEFNGDEKLDRKVNRIFDWLDLPGEQDDGFEKDNPRPQFIAAYVPDVDADGHKYGPNSTYIRSTIKQVDGMLAAIFSGIDERNLTDIVNIVVVSDHGMATTSVDRLIQLEDLINTDVIEHTDGWPLYGLRPYDDSPSKLESLYNQLVVKSKSPEYKHAFDVYLRDENMPARYHFTQNDRIAPLWIVPKAGWAIVTRDEFDIPVAKSEGLEYLPHGLHGYDDQHPLMRAIFVARGPAFPHEPGSKVAVFQNVEVYNIVCDSLGLEPGHNNGTLRLPLRTEGVHDFGKDPIETPDDHDADEIQVVPNLNQGLADHADKHEVEENENLNAGLPDRPTIQTAAAPEVQGKPAHKGDVPERPVVHDGDDKKRPESYTEWWEWMKSRLDSIRWWAKEHMGKHPQNDTETTKNGSKDGS